MTDKKIDITELNPNDGIEAYWLKFIHRAEVMAENHRVFFYVGDDEKFIIEMTVTYHDLAHSYDLMNIWYKHGDIKEKYDTHIGINTYYYDKDNECHGWYNPTLTPDCKSVNFDMLLPYSPENAARLVAAAIRMEEMDIRHKGATECIM